MDETDLSPEAPAATREAHAGLTAHLRRLMALEQVGELVGWDQRTMMPPEGGGARAEHAAAVEAAAHALRTDPRLGDWLATLEADAANLGAAARANLREARRIHDRAARVPDSLAAAIAHATSRARPVWATALANNRFADFAPVLGEIVALKRREAACLAGDGANRAALYDALLDDFEPGARGDALAAMFAEMRPRLLSLRERIAERVAARGNAPEADPIPEDAQIALAHRLCAASGYGPSVGRLDRSEHPFSVAFGTRDVRITTRARAGDPWGCVYATLHELGHALYKLAIDPALELKPAGRAASTGLDESQARLWENQIGRSRAFCDWLAPRVAEAGGGPADPERLHASVNRVAPGFIRAGADEVHYNLHVFLRLELEQALIAGELEVADLEAEWASRVGRDFGRAPPDAARGVLQDVHWSRGVFGYFPAYALGNVYAGSLHMAMRRDLPDLDAALAAGDLAPARAWLGERVHRHGRTRTPGRIVTEAAGAAPSPAPLLAYLEEKYTALYGV